MEIREFRITDQPAVAAILGSLAGTGTAAGFRWVAEHEDRVIGCAGCALEPAGARVHSLAVAPEFRRMGVGRFLMMYAMREASRAWSPRMVMARTPADASGFFERLGFRAAEECDGEVEMVKKLEVCA